MPLLVKTGLLLALLGVSLWIAPAPAYAQATHFASPAHVRAALLHVPETALLPSSFGQKQEDRWWARDKALHVSVSFLVTLSGQYALTSKAGWSEGDALPLSMGASGAVGLAKELYDWQFDASSGHFCRRDLAADALGIALAAGFILL